MLKSSVGHEGQDADIRPIVLTGIGLALTLVVVGVLFMASSGTWRPTQLPAFNQTLWPSLIHRFRPRLALKSIPRSKFRSLHAQEDQTLSTYGWIDKNKGVVRIPIDRAIELQLQRGFPTRKEPVQK